jgi:hypothetical protein
MSGLVQLNIVTVVKWLRHYATNRKVTVSIPDEVNFLNVPNHSGRTRPWGLLRV